MPACPVLPFVICGHAKQRPKCAATAGACVIESSDSRRIGDNDDDTDNNDNNDYDHDRRCGRLLSRLVPSSEEALTLSTQSVTLDQRETAAIKSLSKNPSPAQPVSPAAQEAMFGSTNLPQIRASNARLASTHPSLTAVFVGATSGIGLATLQAFAHHVPQPRAFIVGRSAAAFAPTLARLREASPGGEFVFVEADVALLRNVDAACERIRAALLPEKDGGINLLVMSQGFINFGGFQETEDGFDRCQALRYHSRLRFAANLLPAMAAASPARVVSILAGGQEGAVDEADLELRRPGHYSVLAAAGVSATMTTLALEELAAQNGRVGFVHVYPGFVATELLAKSAAGSAGGGGGGLLGLVANYVVRPLGGLVAMSREEAGERMLCYATTAEFGAAEEAEGRSGGAGVHGQGLAKGKKGQVAGCWILKPDGSLAAESEQLKTYRKSGMRERVWEHTRKEWERVLGSGA
ncbi:hypothetical protein MBLNU459_g0872t2 [Dothideomycetes sp. NU459]